MSETDEFFEALEKIAAEDKAMRELAPAMEEPPALPYVPPPGTKQIHCPKCGNRLALEGFTITDHGNETWSADPSIECAWDCGAYFFVTHGMIEWFSEHRRKLTRPTT